jgi:hypothetical protein
MFFLLLFGYLAILRYLWDEKDSQAPKFMAAAL